MCWRSFDFDFDGHCERYDDEDGHEDDYDDHLPSFLRGHRHHRQDHLHYSSICKCEPYVVFAMEKVEHQEEKGTNYHCDNRTSGRGDGCCSCALLLPAEAMTTERSAASLNGSG